MNRLLRTAPTLLAVIAGSVAIAGPAAAGPTRDLTTARAACTSAVDERVASLNVGAARLASAKHLSEGHRATVNDLVTTTKAGLADLRTKIDADADAASLKTDCAAVVGLRVYALSIPKVHGAVAADDETYIAGRLHLLGGKLAAAIGKANGRGDVAGATAKLTELNNTLGDVDAKLGGLGDRLLAVAPSDWDANHAVLSPLIATLRTVHGELVTAAAAARAGFGDLAR
jgi:hypothetical protein